MKTLDWLKCTSILVAVFVLFPVTLVAEASAQVILNSEIKWGLLNPLRGDKSPRAGQLWGSRVEAGESGFLVAFNDGFESPPHIHNVTYRGIVISGLIHNDDPNAEKMWLSSGSYWTQPAGESHITAAKGKSNLIYLEIENGPYLVKPKEAAYDNGEKPVNIDNSNLVWLSASDTHWVEHDQAEIAFLWKKPGPEKQSGLLLKLPAGSRATLVSPESGLRGVIIQGCPSHNGAILKAGSYFASETASSLVFQSDDVEGSLIYIRVSGGVRVL